MAQIIGFVLERAENIVVKRRNVGYKHFLLFPQYFQKAFPFFQKNFTGRTGHNTWRSANSLSCLFNISSRSLSYFLFTLLTASFTIIRFSAANCLSRSLVSWQCQNTWIYSYNYLSFLVFLIARYFSINLILIMLTKSKFTFHEPMQTFNYPTHSSFPTMLLSHYVF